MLLFCLKLVNIKYINELLSSYTSFLLAALRAIYSLNLNSKIKLRTTFPSYLFVWLNLIFCVHFINKSGFSTL